MSEVYWEDMIFAWLFLAVALTLLGAAISLFAQDVEERHEEELAYEDHIGQQRDAITLARCQIEPTCRRSHEQAGARVRAHRASHSAP